MTSWRELDHKRHLQSANSRGVEENTKLKVVVPYLMELGWDLYEDLYFEEKAVDIIVRHGAEPMFLVETKTWEWACGELERAQMLDYAKTHKTPWVIFSSGDRFLLYHALALEGGSKGSFIASAHFADIVAGTDDISKLLRKRTRTDMERDLSTLATKILRLSTTDELNTSWTQSLGKRGPARSSGQHLTEERFEKLLQEESGITAGCTALWHEMKSLEATYPGIVRIECRSKSSGLYLDTSPGDPESRRKRKELLGIYPGNRKSLLSTADKAWLTAFGFTSLLVNSYVKAAKQFKAAPSMETAAHLLKALRELLASYSSRSMQL